MQLGIFCLVGALATFCAGYLLTALAGRICRARSKLFRAVLYYITIALLLLDPLYLSVLCGLFGGGDMNGMRCFVRNGLRDASLARCLSPMGWYSGNGCCRFIKSLFPGDGTFSLPARPKLYRTKRPDTE